MEIIWLGHACFALESGDYRVVLDPYQLDHYPALHTQGDLVLCSHGHFDHNNVSAVELRQGRECPFTVETVETYHDDAQGTKRGMNTMHILRAEGLTVVHAGDLGHFPNEAQLAAIRGCDALLLPVGGYYTIDAGLAKRVAEAAEARVVVPMHYRHGAFGLREVGPVEEFLKRYDAAEVQMLSSNRFTLTADSPRGVVVPKFVI